MKKLSDCIKLIKDYKKTKKDLVKKVVFNTINSVLLFLDILGTIWLTVNFSPLCVTICILGPVAFGLNIHETHDNLDKLKDLKKNYKVSLNVVEAFAEELKAKGIKISKDSLVKSNVHTNKKLNDMKTITAILDDSKEEIRVIEVPESNDIMMSNKNFRIIPSPKEIEKSVYYVDKDLVIDEPEEKQDFNGNSRIKRRF